MQHVTTLWAALQLYNPKEGVCIAFPHSGTPCETSNFRPALVCFAALHPQGGHLHRLLPVRHPHAAAGHVWQCGAGRHPGRAFLRRGARLHAGALPAAGGQSPCPLRMGSSPVSCVLLHKVLLDDAASICAQVCLGTSAASCHIAGGGQILRAEGLFRSNCWSGCSSKSRLKPRTAGNLTGHADPQQPGPIPIGGC